jgi:hypothetical protein
MLEPVNFTCQHVIHTQSFFRNTFLSELQHCHWHGLLPLALQAGTGRLLVEFWDWHSLAGWQYPTGSLSLRPAGTSTGLASPLAGLARSLTLALIWRGHGQAWPGTAGCSGKTSHCCCVHRNRGRSTCKSGTPHALLKTRLC